MLYILNNVPAVVDRFQQEQAIVSTCVIVQSELIYMAQNSQQRLANLIRVQNFLRRIRIYSIDEDTAEICGYFQAELMKKFAPKAKSDRRKFKLSNVGVSINDLWIASIALQHNLTVVSADQDFARMREAQEFRLEAWHTQ